jgi:type II secretion system protein I
VKSVQSDARGFTIIEALVALAIVALISAGLYRIISTNLRTSQQIADRRLATLVAQSALDLASVRGTGSAAAQQGASAGYVWNTSTEPLRNVPLDQGLNLKIIRVSVFKAGSPRRIVVLQSVSAL